MFTFLQNAPDHRYPLPCNQIQYFCLEYFQKQMLLLIYVVLFRLRLLVIFFLRKLFWLTLLISQLGKQITAGSFQALVESLSSSK